jgi:hypothetical protein
MTFAADFDFVRSVTLFSIIHDLNAFWILDHKIDVQLKHQIMKAVIMNTYFSSFCNLIIYLYCVMFGVRNRLIQAFYLAGLDDELQDNFLGSLCGSVRRLCKCMQCK